MKEIIKVIDLVKDYKGKRVLDKLSFLAYSGDIVGLIGPNGAGKSTTMRIIMRLIGKTSGSVWIEGKEVDKRNNTVSSKVGFASESPSFYCYLSGYENLMLMANLYNGVTENKVRELIQFVGLQDSAGQKVKTYSTGMKQRLGLARALLNDPSLLILDEPTNGLDPRGMRDIYQLLQKLASEQKIAILISSHQLHDVEKICNKVIMIDRGNTIYNGDLDKLSGSLEDSYFSLVEGGGVC